MPLLLRLLPLQPRAALPTRNRREARRFYRLIAATRSPSRPVVLGKPDASHHNGTRRATIPGLGFNVLAWAGGQAPARAVGRLDPDRHAILGAEGAWKEGFTEWQFCPWTVSIAAELHRNERNTNENRKAPAYSL